MPGDVLPYAEPSTPPAPNWFVRFYIRPVPRWLWVVIAGLISVVVLRPILAFDLGVLSLGPAIVIPLLYLVSTTCFAVWPIEVTRNRLAAEYRLPTSPLMRPILKIGGLLLVLCIPMATGWHVRLVFPSHRPEFEQLLQELQPLVKAAPSSPTKTFYDLTINRRIGPFELRYVEVYKDTGEHHLFVTGNDGGFIYYPDGPPGRDQLRSLPWTYGRLDGNWIWFARD
jgi:hypothetical protein